LSISRVLLKLSCFFLGTSGEGFYYIGLFKAFVRGALAGRPDPSMLKPGRLAVEFCSRRIKANLRQKSAYHIDAVTALDAGEHKPRLAAFQKIASKQNQNTQPRFSLARSRLPLQDGH
jgi:hypothetical protein